MMWDGWMMHNNYGPWGGIMMFVFLIAIIVGVVFLIKWLINQSQANNRKRDTDEEPLEILKRRYAKGEIDKQEFEEKKRDLGLE